MCDRSIKKCPCIRVCVRACIRPSSRSCPSQFPPCRQGQQQAPTLLAANRPNLDPRGQHSCACVCVCVLRIYHNICDWLVVTGTYVMGPLCRFHPVWLNVCVCVCVCVCVYKHAWVNLIYFQVYYIFCVFQGVCVCVWVCMCVILSAGISDPRRSSLGYFNTFTAGFPPS